MIVPGCAAVAPVVGIAAGSVRGTGAAGRLMGLIATQARAEGSRILALCGYARGWLALSRSHRDLLA